MPDYDYKLGDEVVYCGPDDWLDWIVEGPHFCVDLLGPPVDCPEAVCMTHLERHDRAVVSGTQPYATPYWCACNWRKAPEPDEIECGKFVQLLMNDPVAFVDYLDACAKTVIP